MSTTTLPQGLNPSRNWLHRWIYYLAAGFMFTAGALRSILVFNHNPLLNLILLLLMVFPLLFIGNLLVSRWIPWSPIVFISLEVVLILALLLVTRSDFFAFLFAILAMQAMQKYPPWMVWILIGLSALLTFLTLVPSYGAFQAVALALVFSAVSVFMAAYIWSTHRTREIQQQQQALMGELQETNRRLESYSQQKQQLAAGRERQRLARELHDSVTQTIFSMTLTTQSALLLLDRGPQQVAAQLDRLDQLAHSTLSEMQVLISKLGYENATGGGFLAALQQHLADRRRMENLSITLDVEGSQQLDHAEEAGLFRIAQEALNNIVKHARVSEAVLRLHLTEPFWMEVVDRGAGFDLTKAQGLGRVGLASMRERAAEIGWNLKVDSSTGSGTRIRVEKGLGGVEQT